jgi:hypothetical protein
MAIAPEVLVVSFDRFANVAQSISRNHKEEVFVLHPRHLR